MKWVLILIFMVGCSSTPEGRYKKFVNDLKRECKDWDAQRGVCDDNIHGWDW